MPVLFPPVLLLARLAAIPHALAPTAPFERRGVGAGLGLVAVGAHIRNAPYVRTRTLQTCRRGC